MVRKKLEVVKVDGETESSLGDASKGVNGRLLPPLDTEVGEKGAQLSGGQKVSLFLNVEVGTQLIITLTIFKSNAVVSSPKES